MPLYTYRCKENGHEFQVRQRMLDDPLTECIVCGGPCRRVVGTVGVVFKGSGFYVTDNRATNSNGPTSKSSRSAETTSSAESSSSTSTSTSSSSSTTSAATSSDSSGS
ncbi:MAG: FmdB family transcriptional regulator [Anaerolineae bacterium]|nr:FmdB family transcriptional regulator [Anaerolineae bacterium]